MLLLGTYVSGVFLLFFVQQGRHGHPRQHPSHTLEPQVNIPHCQVTTRPENSTKSAARAHTACRVNRCQSSQCKRCLTC